MKAKLRVWVTFGDDLKFVMLTSAARVHRVARGEGIEVSRSAHQKCDRCWHYREDVNDKGLCARCEANLHGAGETREYA